MEFNPVSTATDQSQISQDAPLEGHPRRWWILFVVALIVFILTADNTILNIAIPTLGQALKANASTVKWFIEAYVLVFCGLMLTGGSLADRYGVRLMIPIGLVIYGASTLVAGLAGDSTVLIVGRAGMGIGAAMMFPATLSVLKQIFSDAERPRAIAFWSGAAILGAMFGPLLGGWMIEHFPWNALFLYKIPIVLITGILGWILIPRLPTRAVPLDLIGSFLSVAGVTGLVFAIIEGPKWGLASLEFWIVTLVAIGLITAFVVWELRVAHPMLDVMLFKNPAFSAASLSVVLGYFAISGLAFSLPQYLQYVSGYTPLQAALRTLPFALAALVGNIVGEPVIARIGTRWTIIAGLLITATSFLLFATVGPSTGDLMIIVAGSLLGFGAGISGTASFTSVLQSVPSDKAGSASAVNETGIELGNALGLAVLGTVLSGGFTRLLLESPLKVSAKVADNILATLEEAQRLGGAEGKALNLAAQTAFSGSMDNMSLIGTAVVVAGALVAWIYLPKRGETITP
jgi:EmrB/QacA subfamily drug resistance transporter